MKDSLCGMTEDWNHSAQLAVQILPHLSITLLSLLFPSLIFSPSVVFFLPYLSVRSPNWSIVRRSHAQVGSSQTLAPLCFFYHLPWQPRPTDLRWTASTQCNKSRAGQFRRAESPNGTERQLFDNFNTSSATKLRAKSHSSCILVQSKKGMIDFDCVFGTWPVLVHTASRSLQHQQNLHISLRLNLCTDNQPIAKDQIGIQSNSG